MLLNIKATLDTDVMCSQNPTDINLDLITNNHLTLCVLCIVH